VTACAHLDQIREVEPSTPEGCTDCLAKGTRRVHLRECPACGHVCCCDSSPHRHATAHVEETDHPVMRSFQPGENRRWSYPVQMLV
jgi:hypothetical protein